MQLTEKQVLAIKRKRGELDLTINALTQTTGNWRQQMDVNRHFQAPPPQR